VGLRGLVPFPPLPPVELERNFHIHISCVTGTDIHRVPEKKQATLIFAITSPSVEIFFTIFEAFCSGIIHA